MNPINRGSLDGNPRRLTTRRPTGRMRDPVSRGFSAPEGPGRVNPFNGRGNPGQIGAGAIPGFAPPNGSTVFDRSTPATNGKRRGVDNNIIGPGSVRRPRLDIGGTSSASLARMAGTVLGSSLAPPVFSDSHPALNQFQSGPEGAPFMGGVGPIYDPYQRGITPTSRSDPQQISWGNMPAERPSIWDSSPASATPNGMAGTASGEQFINLGGGAQVSIGTQNPFEEVDWQKAAANASKSNMTGTPNARVKYTWTLTHQAAQYAAFQMTAFPVISMAGGDQSPTDFEQSLGSLMAPTQRGNIFVLPVANYLMAANQPRPTSPADVVTPAQMIETFKMLGVAASEEGGRETLRSEYTENGVLRNVVVTMGGEAFTVNNCFGKGGAGCKVGFIVKAVPISDVWAVNPRDHGTFNLVASKPDAVVALNLNLVARNVIQRIPWLGAPGVEAPSHEELLYVDDFGVEHTGIFEPFGSLMQKHGEFGSDLEIDRAWCSANACQNAGQLGVLISRKPRNA